MPILYFVLAAAVVVVDQVVKYLVRTSIPLHVSLSFLPGLDLTYLQNTGAAFSLFNQHTWVLALLSGVVSVLLAAALGITGLIQTQSATGRARAAADLAAISGATVLSSVIAPSDPCAMAQRVAAANGASVSACSVAGEDVTVSVVVPTTILGRPRQATAQARAGPVDAPPTP